MCTIPPKVADMLLQYDLEFVTYEEVYGLDVQAVAVMGDARVVGSVALLRRKVGSSHNEIPPPEVLGLCATEFINHNRGYARVLCDIYA